MAVRKVAIMVGIIFAVLLIVPASAFAAGSTISGKIDFPASSGYPEYLNMTENLTVTDLTIYAINIQTGFANVTEPNSDGTYQIPVADYGLYQIFVNPDAVADLSRGPSIPQIIQYPNREGTRVYVVNVDSENVKADITGYAPGNYQPPNDLTLTSNVPASTTVTTPKPSATAAPAPGFATMIAVLGMVIAVAAILQRKN